MTEVAPEFIGPSHAFMKIIACFCVVWLGFLAMLTGAEAAPAPETEDVVLQHIEVVKAHQVLLDRLPAAKGAVVTLHLDTNSLTLSKGNPHVAAIRGILQDLDKGPLRISLSLTIAETDDESGTNERIISRPTVYVPQKNGKFLQVQIKPRAVEPMVASSTTRPPEAVDPTREKSKR
jgi:hypothetical protein